MSSRGRTSARLEHLSESWIREMTRVAMECGAVNLSQGYPDFDPPREVRGVSARIEIQLDGAPRWSILANRPRSITITSSLRSTSQPPPQVCTRLTL